MEGLEFPESSQLLHIQDDAYHIMVCLDLS